MFFRDIMKFVNPSDHKRKADCIQAVAVLAIILCFSFLPAKIEAAIFSPTSEEAALLKDSRPGAKLDLSALTRYTEGGRTFFQIDDMRYLAEAVELDNTFIGNRWPGGVLYYQFAPAVTAANRVAWRNAAATWSAVAPVTFTESTGNGNYVLVQNSSGNNSFVGMIGGPQEMNILSWGYRYIIAHEIGHALGALHEHERSNRDAYVNILYANIQSGMQANFELESGSVSYGPYDFDSVMHYERNAFSSNGQNTIEPKPAYSQYLYTMGQTDHLSTQDGAGMAQRYPGGGPISNDNFANRRTITGSNGSVSGSSFGATSQPGEPYHAGFSPSASVWYSWTLPTGGNVTIDTIGSDFDTLLAVYTGNSLSALTPVASNDDISPGFLQSRVTFSAIAGQTCQIAVDGWNGDSGNIVLRWAGGSSAEADFDGNGTTDILFQNNSTGQRMLWYMNGTTYGSNLNLPTVARQWNIVGTEDFNRDGRADILFQDFASRKAVVWYMNGATHTHSAYLPDLPANWSVAATDDFNGDGKPDLLLENVANGQRAVWLMNGVTRTGSVYLPAAPLDWKVAGTGDFNGNGTADVVFQNYATQRAAVWYLNGTTFSGSGYLSASLGPWRIGGVGDFNQDPRPELILQDFSSGNRALWLLNGLSVTNTIDLPPADVQWDIRNR
jgi:hypothetical protein